MQYWTDLQFCFTALRICCCNIIYKFTKCTFRNYIKFKNYRKFLVRFIAQNVTWSQIKYRILARSCATPGLPPSRHGHDGAIRASKADQPAKTPDIHPKLSQCWASVSNTVPAVRQEWVNVSCLRDVAVSGSGSWQKSQCPPPPPHKDGTGVWGEERRGVVTDVRQLELWTSPFYKTAV